MVASIAKARGRITETALQIMQIDQDLRIDVGRELAEDSRGIFVAPFEQGEIGPDLFRAACNFGLERLASKRADRPYRAGRSKERGQDQEPEAYRRVQDQF